MKTLVTQYLSGGGFALQLNVTNAEILRKAQKNPEQYKNLQIRLCGWNVYFTALPTQTQDDIISRAENGAGEKE